MQCGVLAYLLKPFNRAAVIEATRMAIAWHTETVARGPKVEDSADALTIWLESIDAQLEN
jgi:YesN/AraC family two-component response regulator